MRKAAAVGALAALLVMLVAAPARGDGPVLRQGIEYARAGRTALLLDAYLPREPGPHPAVVVIHGGGWSGGSRSDVAYEGLWFADRGYAAFVIDYRLAPAFPFPAAVHDAQAAVRWVRRHASAFDVDPRRLAAFGGSAGGHLAAMLAVAGRGPLDRGSRVRVAISWSAPLDLARTIDDAPAAFRPQVREMIERFLGCRGPACRARMAQASPISHVDATDGAVFIANSRGEIQSLAQAQRMADALDAKGIPSELVSVPGNMHAEGYTFASDGSTRETVLDASFRFLGTWLEDAGSSSPRSAARPSPLVTAFVLLALVASGPAASLALVRLRSAGRYRARPAGAGPDLVALARIESLQRTGASQGEIATRLSLEGFV
jgi:acetyl esterase/lipase